MQVVAKSGGSANLLYGLHKGIALALAPLGAWIAIKGAFDTDILPLCFAVMFWVAGFDTVYACLDADFDAEIGLFSLPARVTSVLNH